jgi:hypothetical protein
VSALAPLTAADSIIGLLGRQPMPLEMDCLSSAAPRRWTFAFRFRDVPFTATVDGGDVPLLTLRGSPGRLPYSIESKRRRQAACRVLDAARRATGLGWRVTEGQEIAVEGAVAIARPLTPTATLAAATLLLLKAQAHLDVLLEELGRY